MKSSLLTKRLTLTVVVTLMTWSGGTAYADGPTGDTTGHKPSSPTGGANGQDVYASAGYSHIQVRQVSGPTGGKRGALASVDVNWKPPACWYEPVFTGQELKDFVDKTNGAGDVGIHQSWFGKGLWTDHYRDGKPEANFDDTWSQAPGYKDYNIGKKGYFWRSVAPDDQDPASWDCGRIMFWQDAGVVPKVPHAPTPKMLADYAYNQIKVPDTEIELKPTAKSTVNVPTWVWQNKGRFQEIKVRAELPRTDLWAETTAKPVALHLDPGTEDATTLPASGDCAINDDGSVGTPWAEGDGDKTPPCGITYLRTTDGTPYHLKASITWQISWKGTGDSRGNLPDGTFETTQDMNVQEIQSVNR
ncbi:hypothetical protein [Streptomyces alanosinicus]|uniref:Secreted protein n=1 Tax=Streptomyces alanosinicus TaxID=68171 RepID=A0A918YPY4_9ACTN|nr:hypothetical protein [Streptomyces alanosinicus]GHE12163.1 hypothetical protein GCM10010339_74460 [Streptomyces alanosinicus]